MKIEKEIKQRQTVVICDFCKEDIGFRAEKCEICGRDVCSRCAILTDSDYLGSGHYLGDYPNFYCKECWDRGEQIRENILTLRKALYDVEAELFYEWVEEVKGVLEIKD